MESVQGGPYIGAIFHLRNFASESATNAKWTIDVIGNPSGK
jgi:hypothetical protein